MKSKTFGITILFSIIFMLFMSLPVGRVKADEVSAIALGTVDYDNLTIQIYPGGNSIVYYSTDKTNWIEVEGEYISNTKSYIMDISWISSSKDVTLYFKGDVVNTIKSVTLPEQNTSLRVVYNKASSSFTFTNAEDAESFIWRKATDYYWTEVDMDESSSSYKNFLADMEELRIKGAKIYIKIPQIMGDGKSNTGMRPSKEVAVTITAMEKAPSVKVNSSKLTLNTSTSMEYYNTYTSQWEACSKTMTIEELAPKALYKNGASDVTVMIRTAATPSKPCSKTAYVTVPGQSPAPLIGDISKDVTYYYMNDKLILLFNNASASNKYEYTYAKPGTTFDISTATWRTVTSTKQLTISSKTIPEGSIVYVRRKGIDASTSKNTEVVLSSAANSFTVDY
jgi:hypothetical protein